jgi:lysophospholipase L1-like esterase
VLIVGDSVAFGVGVDDGSTAASRLQRLLGDGFRVVNGGVGGYSGRQCVKQAAKLARGEAFHSLIYIACQNDFMEADDWNGEAEAVLKALHDLSEKFNERILVLLHTTIQVSLHDIFLEEGWRDRMIEKSKALNKKVSDLCNRYDMAFLDSTAIVSEYMREEQSILAGFALYVDQCHLSPRGGEVLAKELFSSMTSQGWIPER